MVFIDVYGVCFVNRAYISENIEVSDNIQPLTKCGDLSDWSFLVNLWLLKEINTRGLIDAYDFVYEAYSSLYLPQKKTWVYILYQRAIL